MAPNTPSSRQPRALAKCVDIHRLEEWVAEPARRRIDLAEAQKIIRVHYCAALVGRGVCPIHCERCREEIVDLFRLEGAKSPGALLTWTAKDHSARMIERLIQEQKDEDRYEFPTMETLISNDPFAALYPKKKIDNLFLELEKDYL